MNQLLLEKLKKQVSALWTLKFRDWDDVKFLDWVHKTRLLILFLSFDKKEEYLRKELIVMLEKCVNKMPKYELVINHEKAYEKIIKTKEELQGLLKSFIEVLELREKDLKDEEKQEPKKTTTKKKSD